MEHNLFLFFARFHAQVVTDRHDLGGGTSPRHDREGGTSRSSSPWGRLPVGRWSRAETRFKARTPGSGTDESGWAWVESGAECEGGGRGEIRCRVGASSRW